MILLLLLAIISFNTFPMMHLAVNPHQEPSIEEEDYSLELFYRGVSSKEEPSRTTVMKSQLDKALGSVAIIEQIGRAHV